MDSRFFITVALKPGSYEKVVQQFNQISSKANQARMAAAGIGKGAAASATQLKQLQIEGRKLTRILMGMKPLGAPAYKAITNELKRAKYEALALKSILSTPPPAHLYRSLFSQLGGQIKRRPGMTTYPHPGVFRDPPPAPLQISDKRWRDIEKWQNYAAAVGKTEAGKIRRTGGFIGRPYASFADQINQGRANVQRQQFLASGGYTDSTFSRQQIAGYQQFGKTSDPFKITTTGQRPYQKFAEQINNTKQLASTYRQSLQPAILATGNSLGAATVAAEEFYGVQKKGIADVQKTQKTTTDNLNKNISLTKQQHMEMISNLDAVKSKVGAGHLELSKIAQKRQMALTRAMTGTLTGTGQYDPKVAEKYDRVHKKLTDLEGRREKRLSKIIEQKSDLTEKLSGVRQNAERTRAANAKKSEEALKNYGRVIDANSDRNNKFNKSLNQTGKNQSFINSRFGKFSIIMSGLAATLFVWQNIVRVIRQVVGVGVELETTFVNIADKVDLSTKELQNLEKQAREAGKTGIIKAPEFADIVAGYVKIGVSVEDATEMMNTLVERQKTLFDGTTTGRLKEAAGLFKELAAQGFEYSQGPLNSALDGLNQTLKEIVESASGWEFLARSIDAVHKGLSFLAPVLRLSREWVNLIWVKTGAVDLLKTAWDKASGAVKNYSDEQKKAPVAIGTGKFDAGVYKKAIEQTQPQLSENTNIGGYEDFDALNTSVYDVSESFEVAERAANRFAESLTYVRKNTKDAEDQLKKLPADLKKAAQFFGQASDKLIKTQIEEIDRLVENLLFAGFDQDKIKGLRDILIRELNIENIKPTTDIFKRQFDKFGIITKEFYDSVSEQRDVALQKDLLKLQEYAKKFGLAFKNIEFTPDKRFEIVPEDFDLQGAIGAAAQKYAPEGTTVEDFKKYLEALFKQESQFDPYAVGRHRETKKPVAFGIAQLKESTAEDLGVDPFKIRENIEGGAKYFAQLMKKFPEDIRLAIAAYNAGPTAVTNYKRQIPPFDETEEHNRRVMANIGKDFDVKLNIGLLSSGPEVAGTGEAIKAINYEIESLMHLKDRLGNAPLFNPQDLIDQAAFSQYQSDISKQMGFLRNYYEATGKMSEDYYKNELAKIEFNRIQMTKSLESAGIADAKLVADRIANRQRSLLIWDKIYADEVGITKDAITALEKLFSETGYYDPRLADVADLKFQQRMKRVLASFKIGPDVSPQSAYFSPDIFESEEAFKKYQEIFDIAGLKEQLTEFDNERKKDLEGWQAYYDATGNMAKAHVVSEKARVDVIIGILEAEGVEVKKLVEIRKKLTEAIDEKANAGKIKVYQDLYSTIGTMTSEYYQWEIAQAKKAADKLRALGKQKAADELEAYRTTQTEVKNLLSKDDFASGIEAKMKQSTLDMEKMAKKAYDLITETVQGSRRIMSDSLFGIMQGEFESLEDVFDSLGNSFKAMIDRMAADLLAAELGKLLFGQLAGGAGTLSGGAGSGAGLLGMGVSLVGSLLGAFSGGGGYVQQPGGMSTFDALQAVRAKAKGGAYATGGAEIKKFASGGVVTKPTLFDYSDGVGLMGEAGPEAIMPLKKMPSGNLGIETTGTKTINVSPTIIVQAPEGKLARQSMNQLTSRMGNVINNSIRRNN